jgi:hypothetical protein
MIPPYIREQLRPASGDPQVKNAKGPVDRLA